MFISALDLADGHQVRADVCIVGAGPAGITLAMRLSEAGKTVCVLESGGLELDDDTQSLYRGTISGLPYTPLHAARVRYFGGTTNHWSGWCRPLDAVDFEQRPWVPYSGWPFGLDELQPYYDEAQSLFGLRPRGFDVARWPLASADILSLDPDVFRTTVFRHTAPTRFGVLYREAIAASDKVSVYLHANALRLVPDNSVRHVADVEACSLGGKRITVMASTYVLATGGIENARLLLASDTVQTEGLGNGNDLVGRFFMDHPGISSGYILFSDPDQSIGLYLGGMKHETLAEKIDGGNMEQFISPEDKATVLAWIRQGSDREAYERQIAAILNRQCAPCHNPQGIGFQNPLQQYDQVLSAVGDDGAEYGAQSGNAAGDATAALHLTREAMRRRRTLNYCAIVEGSSGWSEVIDDDGFFGRVGNVASNFGVLTSATYRKLFKPETRRKLLRIINVIEPSPNPDSRVTLNAKRDPIGMRTVDLAWRLNNDDQRTIDVAHEMLASELGHSELGRMLREFEPDADAWPDDLTHGWHHMGTTRMHEDPAQGVVDANGRVHGLDNLYVAGSSVFPTYGFSQPTFTIVALALRLAHHLAAAKA